jgi:hypothetical protein
MISCVAVATVGLRVLSLQTLTLLLIKYQLFFSFFLWEISWEKIVPFMMP